jgi:hypothetical protein
MPSFSRPVNWYELPPAEPPTEVPQRLVGVVRRDLTVVGGDQTESRPQRIGQQRRRNAGRSVGTREVLIDAKSRQQVSSDAVGAVQFLHGIEAVVEELGDCAGSNRPLHTAEKPTHEGLRSRCRRSRLDNCGCPRCS